MGAFFYCHASTGNGLVTLSLSKGQGRYHASTGSA